jgi:hypothetical protein
LHAELVQVQCATEWAETVSLLDVQRLGHNLCWSSKEIHDRSLWNDADGVAFANISDFNLELKCVVNNRGSVLGKRHLDHHVVDNLIRVLGAVWIDKSSGT